MVNVRDLKKSFGAVPAIKGIDLPGQRFGKIIARTHARRRRWMAWPAGADGYNEDVSTQ